MTAERSRVLKRRWQDTGTLEDGLRYVQESVRIRGGQQTPEEVLDALSGGTMPRIGTSGGEVVGTPDFPSVLAFKAVWQPFFQYFLGVLLFLDYEGTTFLVLPQRDHQSMSAFEGLYWPDQVTLGSADHRKGLEWLRAIYWGWGRGPTDSPPPTDLVRLDFGPLIHRHLWEMVVQGRLEGKALADTLALLETLTRFSGDSSQSLRRSQVALTAEELPDDYRWRIPEGTLGNTGEWIVTGKQRQAVGFSYKLEAIPGFTGHRDGLCRIMLTIDSEEWQFTTLPLWEEVEWGMAYS